MTPEKFTKADIVDSLYQKTGMSPKEIRTIVDLFVNEVKEALLRQQIIELRGFGTFEVKVRKGRSRSRNPKTGEAISIPVRSHGSAVFRPGRELKQAVWNVDGNGGAVPVNLSKKDLTQRREDAEIDAEFANCAQNSAPLPEHPASAQEREFGIELTRMEAASGGT
jgi:integration host factor subunit beta